MLTTLYYFIIYKIKYINYALNYIKTLKSKDFLSILMIYFIFITYTSYTN